MEVLTASFGFCIGINRAYRGMHERASSEAPFTVAHQNSGMEFDTLRRIERRDPELLKRYPGLEKVSVSHTPSELGEGDRLVLGFHGLSDEAKTDLAKRGVELLEDLICPFIAKLDRLVERYVAAGFDVAMVGSANNHHLRTARKIAAAHGRRCFAVVKAEDIERIPYEEGQHTVLVGEVTGNTETFRDVIARIETLRLPVEVRKTMCSDSYARQKNASELAQKAEVVVLVDDGGDGAHSVYEVCTAVNHNVHRVRAKEEVQREWFDGADTVAVVGGILVPEWTLAAVAWQVRALCGEDQISTSPAG